MASVYLLPPLIDEAALESELGLAGLQGTTMPSRAASVGIKTFCGAAPCVSCGMLPGFGVTRPHKQFCRKAWLAAPLAASGEVRNKKFIRETRGAGQNSRNIREYSESYKTS